MWGPGPPATAHAGKGPVSFASCTHCKDPITARPSVLQSQSTTVFRHCTGRQSVSRSRSVRCHSGIFHDWRDNRIPGTTTCSSSSAALLQSPPHTHDATWARPDPHAARRTDGRRAEVWKKRPTLPTAPVCPAVPPAEMPIWPWLGWWLLPACTPCSLHLHLQPATKRTPSKGRTRVSSVTSQRCSPLCTP